MMVEGLLVMAIGAGWQVVTPLMEGVAQLVNGDTESTT